MGHNHLLAICTRAIEELTHIHVYPDLQTHLNSQTTHTHAYILNHKCTHSDVHLHTRLADSAFADQGRFHHIEFIWVFVLRVLSERSHTQPVKAPTGRGSDWPVSLTGELLRVRIPLTENTWAGVSRS